MLIAHVTFSVTPDDRSRAIDTLKAEVDAVRSMNGCLAYTPFLDPTNPQDVCVMQEWETADDFAAYMASDSFATVGQVLRPIMTAPPVSKRFDASLIENIN